jgi:hypothetical protein
MSLLEFVISIGIIILAIRCLEFAAKNSRLKKFGAPLPHPKCKPLRDK